MAYLAAFLAADHFASFPTNSFALGVLTGSFCSARPFACSTPIQRAQLIGVVCFATVGELDRLDPLGVYRYRLHNLPLFA